MPTSVNPTCYHLSASSIAAFKKCPQAFRMAYREGIRSAEDTESQRIGTTWHKLHEIYYAAAHAAFDDPEAQLDPDDCNEIGMQAVIGHLNQTYATCPVSKDIKAWALERQRLLISFIAYRWYYANDPIEVLASEVPFNLPIHSPKVGLPLPMSQVQRVGKIDHVIRWKGMVGSLERKSTSRSIAPDSSYWDKGQKDTQVSMYALAFRDMLPEANNVTAAIYGPYFELPLTQDKVAIVDEKDRALVEQYEWHANYEHNNWYAGASYKKENGSYGRLKLHRLIAGREEGDGVLIDHANRNGLDCRRVNLRESSYSDNALNSDHEGITKSGKKWMARLCVDGNRTYLGTFATENEARAAYSTAKKAAVESPTRLGNTLYCVWQKPKTEPKMLTQADTAAFIASGEYRGQTFSLRYTPASDAPPMPITVMVGDEWVEIEPGKKGFAIRESIEMYGARLLADIQETPEKYFQRREMTRTDAELDKFRKTLYNVYETQRLMDQTGNYYENEASCNEPFACTYKSICYGPGADAVCDGKTTPPGYKRIFVDLTVDNKPIGESD